ncbi:MAG: hypothetical protein NBV61_01430 [Algoriphagus sp.]|nr:hypothetical protein [Algoriphagus sp.]
MQESWTFDFPFERPSSEAWSCLIQTQQRDLGIFLTYYYKRQGAVVEKVQLKSATQLDSQDTGTLCLSFELIYFNACQDLHETQSEEMKLSFQFDAAKMTLKLVGPYWPSREPDEI